MKKIIALILILASVFTFFSCEKNDNTTYVEICFEKYGSCVIALDRASAPKTVDNFLELVNAGFYDGLKIHRVIPDFMIQGGDPNGDGTGGYMTPDGKKREIYGEFASNGFNKNKRSHVRGTISMARGDEPNSASSQFFICNGDARSSLDGNYAAFGYTVEGLSVIDKITAEVFPKTAAAEYYGTENHVMWQKLGDGVITNEEDKPVIKYIKVLENYEKSR